MNTLTMQVLKLDNISLQDIKDVAQLAMDIERKEFNIGNWRNIDDDVSWIRNRLEDTNSLVVVVKDNKKIVGTGVLTNLRSYDLPNRDNLFANISIMKLSYNNSYKDTGYISYVYVDKKYRGYHIGHDIMTSLINIAKEHYSSISLGVKNPVAKNLYSKLGFKEYITR